MSKKCNRCGRDIPDDAIRCPYCTESGVGVDMTGVSLKDGDEADKAYRAAHSASRPAKQYAPDSVPWLRRTSAVFSVVAAIIYVAAVIGIIGICLSGMSGDVIPFWVGVFIGLLVVGTIYSAIGAHLSGMADIVDGLEALCASRTDERP
nr:MAG TPA: zinc-ribbon containing domain protein [Caudoviricetes sp.]